ncbi:MAG: MATE family efflux transporter [Pseudomonadota bacterium]
MTNTRAPSLLTEMRSTLWLAAPLIVGQLSNVGMTFVDTLMAGRLSPQALAAVAMGSTVWNSAILFLIGTLLAVPALVARLDGAGQRPRLARLIRQAIWLALSLSLVLFVVMRAAAPLLSHLDLEPEVYRMALEYVDAISWGVPALGCFLVLRYLSDGLGFTRPTMYVGLAGMLINIPADYVFMFGALGVPAMGARGTGLATTVVLYSQLLIMMLIIAYGSRYRFLKLFRRWDLPRPRRILEITRVGLPIGAAIFVEASMFVMSTLLMGTLGTQAVAGHQVAMNFSAFMFMVPLGTSLAITVRVGNAAGRNDWSEARFRGIAGLTLVLCTQLTSATIILLFPQQIAGLYTDDAAVISIAVSLLFFSAIFQLSDGIQVAAAGALRGLKDTAVPMVIMIAAYWAVGIPLCYQLGIRLGQGGAGIWIGMLSGLTVAAVLLSLRFLRLTQLHRQRALP